jgi:hypothetical protein
MNHTKNNTQKSKQLKGGVNNNIIAFLLIVIFMIFGMILFNMYTQPATECLESVCNNTENLLNPLNIYLDKLLYDNKINDKLTHKNIVKYIDENTIKESVFNIKPNYYIKIPQSSI